jgi:hypothetical protein
MTRFLAALYLACLYFAALPTAHAPTFATCGPAVGFVALAFALRRLTRKEVPA